MTSPGAVPAPRAAHVLQRGPGRRVLLAPDPPAVGTGNAMTAVVLRPPGPGYSIAAERATVTPHGARAEQHWYRAREVDPDSSDDIASLALLRWWSRTGTKRLEPGDFPAFLRDFTLWWARHPECRLAVLVEEVAPDGATTPVAMGWVVPRPDLAGVVPGTMSTPAVSDGVFLLPGTPGARVRRDLAAALGRLAASRNLHLTPLPPRR